MEKKNNKAVFSKPRKKNRVKAPKLATFGKIFSKILGTTILLKLLMYLLKIADNDNTNINGKIMVLYNHILEVLNSGNKKLIKKKPPIKSRKLIKMASKDRDNKF
jgi:hypothetical protein